MKYFEVTNNDNIISMTDSFDNYELFCVLGGWSWNLNYPEYNSPQQVNPSNVDYINFSDGSQSALFYVQIPDQYNNESFFAVPYIDGKQYACSVKQVYRINGKLDWRGPNGRFFQIEVANYIDNINLSGRFQNLGGKLRIFVFSSIKHGSSNNCGLTVYSENGAEIYNSNNKYLRIIDVISANRTQWGETNYDMGNRTYNGYGNITAVQTSFKQATINGGKDTYVQVLRWNNNVSFDIITSHRHSGPTEGVPTSYNGSTLIIVCDVSNLMGEGNLTTFPLTNK